MHVSQVDSQMLHIDYFEQEEGYVKDKGFTQSLDLRALTRKSRDLIVLSIRCFSALNSYKNSKIISMLNQDEENPEKQENLDVNKVADLALELESVKRELYHQIDVNNAIKADRAKVKREFQELENEMQTVIGSYSQVIESQEHVESGDNFRIRHQLKEHQDLSETLQKQISDLNEQMVIINDEKPTLERKNDSFEKEREKLNKRIKRYKDKNGVPETEFMKIQKEYESIRNELADTRQLLDKRQKQSIEDKKMIQQLETEKLQLSNFLKRKDDDISKYQVKLKDKKSSEKKFKKEMEKLSEQVKTADELTTIQEENEALISQKNVLLKFKETIGKELEKLKQDGEKKAQVIDANQAEYDQFKAEAELTIQRLREANQRMSEENMELENENHALQKDHRSLEKQISRLTQVPVKEPRLSFNPNPVEDYKMMHK